MTHESAASPRPNLLVLTPSVDMYGSDRSLLPVLAALSRRFDITLVTPRDGPLVDLAISRGYSCHVIHDWSLKRSMIRLRRLPGLARRIRSSLRFLRALDREKSFVGVYANTSANALLPFVKRAVDVPLVVHVRELPRDRPTLMRLLLRLISRVADSVICNSSFTAEALTNLAPHLSDRVRVAVNGVPAPGRPPRVPSDDGVLDVVCVGRIHPKKGHSVLLQAAEMAADQGAEWRIHFRGASLPEHADLEAGLRRQADEAGLAPKVSWHGYRADTDELYDDTDVVVVPSVLPEEFSRVAAEAQIRGIPVVATGPGGPSEIVTDGETGRIVPAGDAAALCGAVRELEDDRKRKEWGAEAARRAHGRFDESDYAARMAGHVLAAVETRSSLLLLSPSSDLYGSDRALLNALPGLLTRHDIVLAVAAPGPLVREARRAGAAVIELPDFAARRRYLRPSAIPAMVARNVQAAWRIRRYMRRRNAAALYVNTVAVPMMPILRLLVRRPVLVHVHERARGGRWEQTLITFGVKRGADLVVTNSEFTAATLDLDRTNVQLEVVHNGIDPAPLAEPDPDGPVRIVCVARLHPKKGQWVLIEAVARLVAAGHDLAVDLVGDALPEHERLERDLRDQVERAGLGDRVVFHGYVSDVDSIYRRSHIVAVPSVDPEEFSLVAAEGQIRGLAAVVTGPGGVSEVVADGETGLVVPPDDVEALTASIESLLVDRELLDRLGTAGRARMLERFTVSDYQQRMAAVVDRLVAGE